MMYIGFLPARDKTSGFIVEKTDKEITASMVTKNHEGKLERVINIHTTSKKNGNPIIDKIQSLYQKGLAEYGF